MSVDDNSSLFEALKELDFIPENRLKELYETSQKDNIPLERLIIENDLMPDVELGKIIADLIGIPLVQLSQESISRDVLTIIPSVYARKIHVISYKQDEKALYIAMNDPGDNQIAQFLEKKTGLPIVVRFATERDIANAFNLYSKDIAVAFEEIISKHVKEAEGKSETEPPIIKIVDTLIKYAYQNKSSDIHLDPLDEKATVRFRVDGILHDVVTVPIQIHNQVVTRIKVLSRLRTDEHQSAQDGKLRYTLDSEQLDIRVSIVPITEGEKVVMRLLSDQNRQFSLHDLGLFDEDLEKVKMAYKRPYGMVLATGPTGSGKTTTLYSILKLLNERKINIMTIEDPVEYDMQGVNQIQVNKDTNLTFAEGLRSIVRQDPDIILVGEIRDPETAGIAINSAMTGHLVLSTLHTNDASTAFPRLTDMKVEPFLAASTINVVIAQRLVRQICTKCRTGKDSSITDLGKDLPEELLKQHFGDKKMVRLYYGKGCKVCHNTGYRGRIGIFEVLQLNNEIKKAIVDRKPASDIKDIAIKYGMSTMIDDGIRKVVQGLTTIEEVLRVTKE